MIRDFRTRVLMLVSFENSWEEYFLIKVARLLVLVPTKDVHTSVAIDFFSLWNAYPYKMQVFIGSILCDHVASRNLEVCTSCMVCLDLVCVFLCILNQKACG